MKKLKSIFISIIVLLSLVITGTFVTESEAKAASKNTHIPFIVLTLYSKSLNVGDTFALGAVTSTGAIPTFSSSNSKVASVNTYGKITAKSAGTANITAKIKGAEATCKVQVKKTDITVVIEKKSLEVGESIKPKITISTGHTPTVKSNKSSVVSVEEDFSLTANKPGEAKITVSVDGAQKSINIKVKKPDIKLSNKSITMFRNKTYKLSVSTSSGRKPIFRTSKKRVATVSEDGMVKAMAHGTATITVSLDGTSKTCEVTVKSPKITIKEKEVTLSVGKKKALQVKVSSGNKPVFKSSKTSVATVDENGYIKGIKKGTAVITVSEDGTKESVYVTVK